MANNNGDRDALYLNHSEQPVTQLTNKVFDGENYISWARQAKLALAAKQKLGFINGQLAKPTTEPHLEKWLRIDSMVFCWILNSLSHDISSTLIYATSSKELWDELAERYGQTNGPLVFQLRNEMSNTKQGDDSVTLYYSKLKRAWDEYKSVEETPQCTCGALANCECNLLKRIHDLEQKNHLLQFLMGLNSSFDQARGHILAIEPLPPIGKAYSMLQQDERQRLVYDMMNVNKDNEVYAANNVQEAHNVNQSNDYYQRRDNKRVKPNTFCDHCKLKGHTVDTCFKLNGYPEWYKGDKRRGGSRRMANQAYGVDDSSVYDDEPLNTSNLKDNATDNSALVHAVCQQVLKALQGNNIPSTSNFASSSKQLNQHFDGPYY